MKRKFVPLFLCLLLLVTCLTGCGGDSGSSDYSKSIDSFTNGAADSYDYNYEMSEQDAVATSQSVNNGSSRIAESRQNVKRIYTASLNLETTQFSQAVSAIENLTVSAGGYLEYNNSYTRTKYYGYGDSDDYVADMSIRVPVENFEGLLQNISDNNLISVVGKNVSAQDVSESYYDLETRLKLAREKVEKLEDLLEKAETIDEILSVENSMNDALYQVESLQGQLNSYDSRIEYSRIDISLSEVTALTMTARATGYGNKLLEGFKNGFTNGVEFFADLLLGIVSSWLILLVIVIVVIIVVRIGKKGHKKRQAKRAALRDQQAAERADRQREIAELRQILSETDAPVDGQATQGDESNSGENL